jgi:hypothetical protein
VWGSEFTSKGPALQGGPAETAAGLNAIFWALVVVVVVVVSYPFSGTAEPVLFLNLFGPSRTISNLVQRTLLGNFDPAAWVE